ncbi:MAG: UxaA family hydrolase, partial [Candidatus Latescibacteria bacterium]|nr:UxaA family hydrolase [Candidatus Latescibacterota bacterium]
YFRQKVNRIDFNSGTLLNGKEDTESAAKRLLRMIIDTASGKPTRTDKPQDYFLNIPMQYFQA